MGLTFDSSQVDAALRKLAGMDTTPVVQSGADVLAAFWHDGAPEQTGELKRQIYAQTFSPTEGEAGTTVVYGADTEFRSSRPGWAAAATAAATDPATEAMGTSAAQLLLDTAKKAGN